MVRQLLSSFSKWLPKFGSVHSTSLTSTTVADDLEKLESLLNQIQDVLQDAAYRESKESSVRLWLKELMDVAYDAEDVQLEYTYQVLQAKVAEVNPFASGSHFAVADRIKKIRERFDSISRDREILKLKPGDGEIRHDSVSEHPRETFSMVNDREIYGREKEKEKLLDHVLSDSTFEVIAVVGMGGLGKTTLAQLVYNDPSVSYYFPEMRIWIWVPDDCNLTRLTKLMIERITNSPCNLSDFGDLQESLQKSLQGKRVFLVLDDVWINEKEELWEPLSNIFRSAEMIKIIVTTRNDEVAVAMKATVVYHLDYLSDNECWQLFLPRAFGGRNPEDFPSLVEIGKGIVRKCHGLPLAVKFLGALVRQYETDEDAWRDVLDSELWELEQETNILPALRLSYSRMPTNLKPCFEICSMFPKYHVFDKDEIVKLWAAHGYVQHEEMGQKYFNELHRRSFFDEYEEEVNLEVRVKRYRMHDNIRDLARYVLVETNMKHRIRHLFITYDKKEEFLTINDTGAPRTLIVHEDISAMKDVLLKLTSLRHLRYLDISDERDFFHASDEEELLLPSRMGDLVCLRHLKLDIDKNMSALESVGHLYNLVVLEIHCEGLVEFPESFRNLVSLTNIYFRDFQNEQLPALGELPSLKSLTLKRFLRVTSIGNEFCRGVNNRHDAVAFPSLTSLVFEYMSKCMTWDGLQDGDIPQLQKLEIDHCRELSSLPSLQLLPQNLTTLKNSHDGKLCLPQEFGELTKLKSLSGKFRVRNDEQFRILNNLVNLKYLTLENVCSALITQPCLRGNHGVEKLTLKWYGSHDDDDDDKDYEGAYKIEEDNRDFTLRLVVVGGHTSEHEELEIEDYDCHNNSTSEDEELEIEDYDCHDNSTLEDEELEIEDYDCHDNSTLEDKESNDSKNASFSLLENLQPDANLQELEIENYNGDRWPGWIGDPSFNKLTHITLNRCSNVVRLPTLGQLPSLKYLYLFYDDDYCYYYDESFYCLKKIGDEFSRGINNRHDVVAFPSLIELRFRGIYGWEQWDGVLDGDFPQLQKLAIENCKQLSLIPNLENISRLSHLKIYGCPLIKLSSEGPFPPNLKSLHYQYCGSTMCLTVGGKLVKLQNSGEFVVGKDELFEILKNLELDHKELGIRGLGNVKGIPRLELELEKMSLAWTTSDSTCFSHPHKLCLIVGDNNSLADEVRPSNLAVLENLCPRTNLEYLEIQGYDDLPYPTWIGDPSFDKLTTIQLNSSRIGQLPTLGQLPSLEYLYLHSISRMKIIAHEFCRSTFSPKPAFPSLKHLEFEKMNDWEEWYDYGVLAVDFPRLRKLKICDCTKLSSFRALRNLSFLQDLSIYKCPSLQLSPGELKRVNLSGDQFGVRKDELFIVLNKLDLRDLAIKGLGNVSNVLKVEDAPRVGILSLSWKTSACTMPDIRIDRNLVICDNNFIANEEGKNEMEPSLLLEYLQPDTKLLSLKIEGYDSIGYPSWIGHPSFDKLFWIHLCNCRNEQLPSLGQLPALKRLRIHFISLLKRIGHEFCRRSTTSSPHECKVAFPSLTTMSLENMNDLEEWDEVLDGDFPQLQQLRVSHCPKLSSLWACRNPSFHWRLHIYDCPELQLSSPMISFPPDLETAKAKRQRLE